MLDEFLGKRVKVLLTDGRLFVGTLTGFDRSTNVVLAGCVERIIHPDAAMEEVGLGLQLLRGDMVVCIGEVDVEEEAAIDQAAVRGQPLKSTKNR